MPHTASLRNVREESFRELLAAVAAYKAAPSQAALTRVERAMVERDAALERLASYRRRRPASSFTPTR